jgi:membrane protein
MNLKTISKRIAQWWTRFYQQMNKLSGGGLEVIRITFQRFAEERGSETAASLAYYAFFSIFPMLLVFIVVGSFFVDTAVVQAQLLELLDGVLPGAEAVVIENINQVLKLRGTVTFIALVSLVWTSTSVFDILARNINRAFKTADTPDFLKSRLLGFLMFLGLVFLLMLSFAISTIIELMPVIYIPFNHRALHETFLWDISAYLFPRIINVLMFWAMYHWVPTIKVSLRASFIGGLVAGLIWDLLNSGFAWYLSSGLVQYNLVYGSVGTIVALLFWIYLTGTITLIGVHLAASIHNDIKQKNDVQPA